MGVDPILIERWIAARDHASIRAAWEVLPVVEHRIARAHCETSLHGAAQVAGAMLGERADWLVGPDLGPPVFEVNNRICEGSYLDHIWSMNEPCDETLVIHERRDGLRGVQRIAISSGTRTGRPEGGGVTAVRVFDRDRAVTIPIDAYGQIVIATIGEIDLAPLDLYRFSRSFERLAMPTDDTTARALIALLLAEIDAHFDASATWAPGPLRPLPGHITPKHSFVDGERAVTLGHAQGRLYATVHGLAWGQRLELYLDAGAGHLVAQLSTADLERITARLATVATWR